MIKIIELTLGNDLIAVIKIRSRITMTEINFKSVNS